MLVCHKDKFDEGFGLYLEWRNNYFVRSPTVLAINLGEYYCYQGKISLNGIKLHYLVIGTPCNNKLYLMSRKAEINPKPAASKRSQGSHKEERKKQNYVF